MVQLVVARELGRIHAAAQEIHLRGHALVSGQHARARMRTQPRARTCTPRHVALMRGTKASDTHWTHANVASQRRRAHATRTRMCTCMNAGKARGFAQRADEAVEEVGALHQRRHHTDQVEVAVVVVHAESIAAERQYATAHLRAPTSAREHAHSAMCAHGRVRARTLRSAYACVAGEPAQPRVHGCLHELECMLTRARRRLCGQRACRRAHEETR